MGSGFSLQRRRSGRAALVVVLLLGIAAVAGIAWFQEPLGLTFKLQTWDKQAPVAVVRKFIDASKSGDQSTADSLIGDKANKPLTVGGKWVGYQKALPVIGNVSFLIKNYVPKEFPKDPKVNYVMLGEGAAEVWIPDAKGKPNKFRLERAPSGWMLTELGTPLQPMQPVQRPPRRG